MALESVYKHLREKFKPEKVDVLFIGESPPLRKGSLIHYFYNEKEDSPMRLYRKIAYALKLKEPKSEGLQEFKNKNMWLTDVFDEPLKQVKLEAVKAHLDRLIQEIRDVKPRMVITLLPNKIHNEIFKYFIEHHLPETIKVYHINPWRESGENLKKILAELLEDP